MSLVVWSRAVVPGPDERPAPVTFALYDPPLHAAPTVALPIADRDLVELPEPRALRSMTRAALLLAAAGLPGRDVLRPLVERDPFAVGVYCALESGPIDPRSAHGAPDGSHAEFAGVYRSLRFGQLYLRQLPNVAPARLMIFLGLMGPLYVYTHSTYAALHALEQAEQELAAGVVEAALVCSAFSLEDPLVTVRLCSGLGEGRVLSEGAACLLLAGDGRLRDWRSQLQDGGSRWYGIAHPIVTLVERRDADGDGTRAVRTGRDRDPARAQH